MEKILIIEDDPDIQTQLKWGLAKSYELLQAHNRDEALKLFHKHDPAVVTVDLGLPPEEDNASEGLNCIREIMKRAPLTKVIVITGNSDRDNALKAVQMGAYDYYLKPIEINELKVIIKRAFYLSEIESENQKLHTMLEKDVGFAGMLGQSPIMQEIFGTIHKVSTTDASVLITGESGTGKELVAKAMHDKSARKNGPFITINCGAIPENLLESELFGHERGAFTGAYSQQQGKFEFAEAGTLFLDEIGEMSTRLQTKLLRFLQEKKIQRIGGKKDIEIDARIIAATNADLNNAMKDGSFRSDLYYRLSVVSILMPPLRDRGSDIQLLANMLLEKYRVMFKKRIKGFNRAARDAIEKYDWPGNIRELENKLQKAVITAESNVIDIKHMELDGLADQSEAERLRAPYYGIPLKEARMRLERDIVRNAVEKYQGNIKKASEELGVSRPTMYDLIEKYNLSIKDYSE